MSYPAIPFSVPVTQPRDPRIVFESALGRLRPGGGISIVRISVPSADPSLLLALPGYESASLLCPPGDREVCGLGETARIAASGADRFTRVRDRARALFDRIETFGVGSGAPPRLYGGFAFAPGAAAAAPWTAFGDASFVLPRWTYERDARGGTLSFAFLSEHLSDAAEAAARDEFELLVHALEHPAREAPTPNVRAVAHQDRSTFEGQVEEIVGAIRDERFEKVVAARRSEVMLDGEIDPATVVRRLSRRFGGCTTFAFRRGDATFLGATPERLLTLRGRIVRTEALAGTATASEADAERALRDSAKDLEEHMLVVREVERRLRALTGAVERPDHPAIRRLPNVLHLCTPISAVLEHDLHVLDVAALLHPTPAVGGVPRRSAIDWIVTHEDTPRGWYSGPVGWIDSVGDGELSVALRSGLLVGDRAYLWAGGGIVRDSKPAAEYEEAAVKLTALLDALTGGEAR